LLCESFLCALFFHILFCGFISKHLNFRYVFQGLLLEGLPSNVCSLSPVCVINFFGTSCVLPSFQLAHRQTQGKTSFSNFPPDQNALAQLAVGFPPFSRFFSACCSQPNWHNKQWQWKPLPSSDWFLLLHQALDLSVSVSTCICICSRVCVARKVS